MWGICIYPWKVNYFLPPKLCLWRKGVTFCWDLTVFQVLRCVLRSVLSAAARRRRRPVRVGPPQPVWLGRCFPGVTPRPASLWSLRNTDSPPGLRSQNLWWAATCFGSVSHLTDCRSRGIPPNSKCWRLLWASRGHLRAQHGKCGGHLRICAFVCNNRYSLPTFVCPGWLREVGAFLQRQVKHLRGNRAERPKQLCARALVALWGRSHVTLPQVFPSAFRSFGAWLVPFSTENLRDWDDLIVILIPRVFMCHLTHL